MLKLKKLKAEADAKKALESKAAAAGKKVVAKTSAGELILQKGSSSGLIAPCSVQVQLSPPMLFLPTAGAAAAVPA